MLYQTKEGCFVIEDAAPPGARPVLALKLRRDYRTATPEGNASWDAGDVLRVGIDVSEVAALALLSKPVYPFHHLPTPHAEVSSDV